MTMVSTGYLQVAGGATSCGLNRSIAVEIGRSAGATTRLGESCVRALAGVCCGRIKMSDFYGKSSGGGYIYGAGTWCFIAPAGVTKVSAVGIGGGGAGERAGGYNYNQTCNGQCWGFGPGAGGGGGGLVYGNNIPVTPLASYPITVGFGGQWSVQRTHANCTLPNFPVSWCSGPTSGVYHYRGEYGAGGRTTLCFTSGANVRQLCAMGGMSGVGAYYTSCGPYQYFGAFGGGYSTLISPPVCGLTTGGGYGGFGGKPSGYPQNPSGFGYYGFIPYYTTCNGGIPGGTYFTGTGIAGGGGAAGGYNGASSWAGTTPDGGTAAFYFPYGNGGGSTTGSKSASTSGVTGTGGGGGGGRPSTRTYTGAAGGGTEVYVNICVNPTLKNGSGGAATVGGTWGGLCGSGSSYHATSGGNSSNSAKATAGKYGAGGGGGRCPYVSGNGTTWITGVSLAIGGTFPGLRTVTFTNLGTGCYAGDGADGVARIIWSGAVRSFPTTRTGNKNTAIYGTA